jgi:ABC-2 type transport system permease protein
MAVEAAATRVTSWHVYRAVAGAGMRSQMQYRSSFLIQTTVDFLIVISDLAPVYLLATYFGSLKGWTFGELALLYGMVGTSWGVVEAGLRGFEGFAPVLVEGHLDRFLLRPRSVVLQVAAHEFAVRKLGRVAQALLVLVIAAGHLELDLAGWFWIVTGIAGGVLFFTGIVLLGAASLFWTLGQTAELQNMLTYGGSATLVYPVSIYSKWFRRVVTYAIPMAFVNYFPALAALGRTAEAGWPVWFPWLSPLVCGLVLVVARTAFGFGLSRYESTGS